MIIENLTENDDGSATMQVELTKEETAVLISYALNHLMKHLVEQYKEPPTIVVPKKEEDVQLTFKFDEE